MNFDKILTDLIQIVLGLLFGVFHTGYEFVRNSDTFSNSVSIVPLLAC